MTAHGPAGRGRPLRFLALVSAGWVTLRVLLLWPEGATLPQAIRAAVPIALAGEPGTVEPIAPVAPVARIDRVLATLVPRAAASSTRPAAMPPMPGLSRPVPDPARVELALLALAGFGPAMPVEPTTTAVVPLPPMRAGASFSVWAMARPGAARGGPVQLGGGQAGVRMRMPIAADDRIALAGRIATPLAGVGREAALGIEWRPTRAPVALIAERRVALDRGAGGTGIGAVAGIDRPAALAGFDLEAYGQGGAVARAAIEPYADGAVRAVRPVATIGRTKLRLGIGGWGGAQRGGARLDIGPSLVATVPVGRVPVRLSIDWRQRVGGNAAPGSGPAVTLGSDF